MRVFDAVEMKAACAMPGPGRIHLEGLTERAVFTVERSE
jgi:hypothetical protein